MVQTCVQAEFVNVHIDPVKLVLIVYILQVQDICSDWLTLGIISATMHYCAQPVPDRIKPSFVIFDIRAL